MLKVLLVDDNRNFRTSLSIGLKREGFDVETCGNPVEAFNRIQESYYDVLLTDLRMPYFNGYELARLAIKHQPLLYIILLSAYDFKDYVPENREISDFLKLSKPFEMKELLTILSRMAVETVNHSILNQPQHA
jgi:DNA-binding NtrC family response regulator